MQYRKQKCLTKTLRKPAPKPIMQTAQDYQLVAAPGAYKVAIIQTGSWGDNCNSTLMLKPIKNKYPQSHIDVYTSSLYGSAFYNNPYINNTIISKADTTESALHLMHVVKPIVESKGYDIVFLPHPMINPGNWTSIKHPELCANLINAWVRALEHADIEYNLPLETILSLTSDEMARADNLWSTINHQRPSILMETFGASGQSFWNPEWTMRVTEFLLRRNDRNVLISRRETHHDINNLMRQYPGQVYFVGSLTLRECAHIFNKCQYFFSVSSGLSNACNTNWCKKDIVWVETTNSQSVTSAPIRKDGKVFWYENNIDKFLQMLSEMGM